MKQIVSNIFDSVQYWQDKNLLLRAIPVSYYNNKRVVLQLLGITSDNVTIQNDAKKDMWNHQILHYNMGDDILKNTNIEILDDKDFAKMAISKYNRTYIYLSKRLKASRELALHAAFNEHGFNKDNIRNFPILYYMPELFKLDNEIALSATTRNIDNMKYAKNLRKNKYFIIDIMNLTDNNRIKQKILEYIDHDLFNDTKFMSQLGCFDNLCEKFHNDIVYVAHAVVHDIKILKKTKIFDESIIKAALDNTDHPSELVLSYIFKYIEKFYSNYDELDENIKNKEILKRLFWRLGTTVADEFI